MGVHNGFDSDEEPSASEEVDFFETAEESAAEAKLRLAKQYLSSLDGDSVDAKRKRLREDLEQQNPQRVSNLGTTLRLVPKKAKAAHGKQMCTSVCIRKDERKIYSGGNDCSVVEHDVATGKQVRFAGGYKKFDCGGHYGSVLSLAFCEPLNLLCSVGEDALLRLWDPRQPNKCVAALHGHKGPITKVVADPGTAQVFTAGSDKMIKLWDLQHRSVLDSYLGHTEKITNMDILQRGKPITGSLDKSARFWRTAQDSHLLFAKHDSSVDAVAALQANLFVSGGQDGSLHAWSTESSRPVASVAHAHGDGNWITALGCGRGSDLVLSASTDCVLRCWRLTNNEHQDESTTTDDADTLLKKYTLKKQKTSSGGTSTNSPGTSKKNKSHNKYRFEKLQEIPVAGIVADICESENFFVCAHGKQQRLGRWNVLQKTPVGTEVVNGITVLKKRDLLSTSNNKLDEEGEEDEEDDGPSASEEEEERSTSAAEAFSEDEEEESAEEEEVE
ncbi:unnamed protein product [Amoebophrya sp. A25]|nr:unnamed protein product [Amoebophrya sp. A25]|eukprot:GSA25T00018403001.1